jgi:hypothetical protein
MCSEPADVAFAVDASSGKPAGRYGRFRHAFGMRRADLALSGLYDAVGPAKRRQSFRMSRDVDYR